MTESLNHAFEQAEVEAKRLAHVYGGATGERAPNLAMGELRQLPWPEAGIADFRLGVAGKNGECRQLALQVAGDPRGHTIILEHGMPSGRVGAIPRPQELWNLGVQVITYDRPGYGGSERRAGRRIIDSPDDVAAIIEACELEDYSIVGRSGGGAYALACAADLSGQLGPPRLKGRARKIIAFVPPASPDAPRDVRFNGVGLTNQTSQRRWEQGRSAEQDMARKLGIVTNIQQRPLHQIRNIRGELDPADIHKFQNSPVMLAHLALSHLAAVSGEHNMPTPAGWADDEIAINSPWGFDLSQIDGSNILFLAAENDAFCPPSQVAWLAKQIPNARLQIEPGASHFSFMDTAAMIYYLFEEFRLAA